MPSTENMVRKWSGLNLTRKARSRVVVKLNNGVGASGHADLAGQRLVYLETLHDLTHAAASVVLVYAGITTQAAFDVQEATRAGSAVPVLILALVDKVNGGTNTYYWAEVEEPILNVDTLYQKPLFTGHIDAWRYTLNFFTLEITSTEMAEHKEIPDKGVGFFDWTTHLSRNKGGPYPEVWGQPGDALDADKIGDGAGAVPALLVERATLKYLVAGHALVNVAGETNESNPVALWVKIPGYSEALGYLPGAAFDLSALDATGHVIATVTLPKSALAEFFMPSDLDGAYLTGDASNPTNAAGRDAATVATLAGGAPGQTLVMAGAFAFQADDTVLNVYIALSVASADLEGRWLGPQAQIVGGSATGPEIDSAAGWDASGFFEENGTVWTYNSIDVSGTNPVLVTSVTYTGDMVSGDITMVGAWVAGTSTSKDLDVTAQRDWTKGGFQFMELQIRNIHPSNSHDIAFLGFRVQVALNGYPAVFVPCAGREVTFRSVSQGASQNPAHIIADLHQTLLGFTNARIGDTFDAAAGTFAGWLLDVPVTKTVESLTLLQKLEEESRAFTWRDGNNDLQIAIRRLGDLRDITLDSELDIIDPLGDDFIIGYTPVSAVKNRVRLNWMWDEGTRQFTKQYYITEESSYPEDTAREAAAVTSQATDGVTGQMIVDAPHIQDAATALDLLQFLFDWNRPRRRTLSFKVPIHVDIRPGTIFVATHPLLSGPENFIVEEATWSAGGIQISATALSIEGSFADEIGFEIAAVTTTDYGWGSPQYWSAWEVTNVGSTTSVTGRVVDYGLAHWAERIFTDTAEKLTHGAVGSGSDAAAASRVALVSQVGDRAVWSATLARTANVITLKFRASNVTGANITVREIGIFTAATGSVMLARLVLAADFTVPDDANMEVTLTLTVKQPTAGSALTDYGATHIANRIHEDTAEKATHYAIGTGATAEDPTDLTLVAQVSTRQAWSTDYPRRAGLAALFSAQFPAATHGGNTIAEVGIFTAASGSNAVVRKVPATPTVLAADDNFAAGHQMALVDFT